MKESRSRDCSLKPSARAWRPPQSIHHGEGGLLTPQNTTESTPWRGQAGKRSLSGLRFTLWGLHAGWGTPTTSTLRPVPAGFPRSGSCSRSPCTVAATRLGCRSTGGQRHPRPGGIPPLCPKQDSSATGLSHQDPPAWCSGDHWGPTWTPQLVVWAQSCSTGAFHLGQTPMAPRAHPGCHRPGLTHVPALLPGEPVVQSRLVLSQSWGVSTSRKQARFSSLAWKTQSSPSAKGFPRLISGGGQEEMGLAGWEGCSQLQGRATGLSIRNWRRPQAAELGSGLPRNRTEGRELPGGYTMSCGVSLSMTVGEEQAAKWQIPKQPGRAVTERKTQEQGDVMEVMAKPASPRERKAAQLIQGGCTGEIQAKREEMRG